MNRLLKRRRSALGWIGCWPIGVLFGILLGAWEPVAPEWACAIQAEANQAGSADPKAPAVSKAIGQPQEALSAATPTATPSANPSAVHEVERGQREVAYAAWWGFDPQDATRALQSAIRSKARKVIVSKMPAPWIVDKIELVGDKEILFEPGVEVVAKRGSFRGKTDSLFTASNQSRLKLIGPGATLRMWRADYDRPPYEKAEWRHVLCFRGCSDVLVEGLTLAESGGDGIYLGAGRQGQPNRNVVIRNVLCLNNYRQGVSVITAENLLLEKVVLRGTRGTPPQAGIDFEPNHPQEVLKNCRLRDCLFEDNASFAIILSLGALNATSEPVSIRLENCTTRGANRGSFLLYTRNAPEQAARGTVEAIACRFEDMGQAHIVLRNPVGGLQVRFSGCRLADPSPKPQPPAPILFSSRSGDEQDVGQVRFEEFVIVDATGRPPIGFLNPAGVCLKQIQGQILVQKGQGTIRHEVDFAWLEKHFPCDPSRRLPIVPLRAVRPVGTRPSWGQAQHVPRHRLRGTARYLVFAHEGETVRLELAYEQVGRYEGKPLNVEIFDPAGQRLRTAHLPFQKTTSLEFQAKASGVFHIVGQTEANTLRLVRSSHPAAIAGHRGTIHFLGTVGPYYFHVPAKKAVGISVAGEGEQERFHVELTDRENRRLWYQPDADTPRSIVLGPSQQDRVLCLRFARPAHGTLEDVYVQFRGIAPVLSFQPDFLLFGEPPPERPHVPKP